MLILHNINATTLWDNQPHASAIAISDGKITAVGRQEDVLPLASRNTRLIDLQGSAVWPGLTDSHLHLQYYALGLKFIDCETDTRDECLRRVAAAAEILPTGSWIRGHGWNQNSWPEGFGTAALLDRISPDKPVYLTSKSLHSSWANGVALRLAGITSNTPNPQD
ncbi:amidohydrolase, partial [bacterium]|nr:amidohydrolase [bacterium]